MIPILNDFFRIRSSVLQFIDKYRIADDRKNYTKAVMLFQKTLQDTSKRLDNIYYKHVLYPQMNSCHANARDMMVKVASMMVILYITGKYPEERFEDALHPPNTGLDM